MREIKFRGKSLISGEYIYGYYYNMDDNRKGNRRHIIVYESKEAGLQTIHEPVYAETVGQYTGLRDKNGVEIYSSYIYDIGTCTKIIRPEHFIEDVYELMKLIENGAIVEVIGNIYENPGLLEAKV